MIRKEGPEDRAAIHDVNVRAFDGPTEADLVDVLRGRATPFISLVAIEDGEIVGHICFTPVTLESDPACRAVGLAPMAVRPDRQRRGVGTELVRHGLEECRRLGQEFVVVVGHADYYPRFGFHRASTKGLACEFPVPDDVFMVLELQPGSLAGKQGLVRYHSAFSEG